MLSIRALSKTYDNGLRALQPIDLEVQKGEIFALLGPNGAGKTTLIGIVCGLVRASGGRVEVDGHDIQRHWRQTRSMIGLVPQELVAEGFETVWSAVSFSRGLFGYAPDPAHIERVLRDLSLWDKRDERIKTLSGGMKRRVMIAKALAHEPRLLFLDEPTAGVDVELRRELWAQVAQLRETGVTIVLTTHYIEEAEQMADRIGIIHQGRLILVEDKTTLMKKLGKKQLTVALHEAMSRIPPALAHWGLQLAADGRALEYRYDGHADDSGIARLLKQLGDLGILWRDLRSEESSLEEIFVSLVRRP